MRVFGSSGGGGGGSAPWYDRNYTPANATFTGIVDSGTNTTRGTYVVPAGKMAWLQWQFSQMSVTVLTSGASVRLNIDLTLTGLPLRRIFTNIQVASVILEGQQQIQLPQLIMPAGSILRASTDYIGTAGATVVLQGTWILALFDA